jgi:ABC-2 type transport system permease protein
MKRADWIGLYTIMRKETIRIVRIWSQTLLPPVMNVTLYLLIFGSFIGKRIGPMGSDSYASFIVPGLLLMAVITNSYGNVSSSFFGAKFQKNIEEILVSPLPEWLIVLGFSLGGIIRGALVAFCVAFVVLLAPGVELKVQRPGLAIVLLFFTAGFFSLAGLLNAMFAKKFDDISFIPTFVLTPLTYLGGIFYPLSALPDFWQHVSAANPVLHMVNALRFACLGDAELPWWYALAFLIIGNTVLYIVCLYYLKKGLGIRN